MNQKMKIELTLISTLLVLLNFHLVTMGVENPLIYRLGASGPWSWAAFIFHPLVHVSFYHWILDVSTFLVLWSGLQAGPGTKALALIIIGATSFLSVRTLAPQAAASGFCGLSGIDHGLMTVLCLEMAETRQLRRISLLSLGLLGVKSMYELVSGHGLFVSLHMGMCGTPVPESHAGGFLGGILCFFLLKTGMKQRPAQQRQPSIP